MNRDEIFEELDRVREELLVAIEPLPDEALLEPGVMDDWTIADILAHLVAWESEMVTALLRIDQGKTPTRLVDAFADVDDYNARRYQENKGRDLDRIFEDLIGVRVQLEEWLSEFGDKELNDPERYAWSKGLPLWHIIAENSFRHEEEHLPDIKAFAQRWQADSSG
ncbi:MAG: ClbS/DfsB family four-helix bundle protein [Chloroflexota bacterium]|jgi:hypothetical protein